MNKQLLKSIASLAGVILLGVGVTYAAFSSNTATISASTATTGSADIKLCNADGSDDWKNSISPSLEASDLTPGGDAIELTNGTNGIYLGNDGGNLTDNLADPTRCDAYGDTAGSSDVSLNITPSLSNVVCDTAELEEDLMLQFQLGAATTSASLSLSVWENAPTVIAPTLAVDDSPEVHIFAELDAESVDQNSTCTFDITFDGEQPAP